MWWMGVVFASDPIDAYELQIPKGGSSEVGVAPVYYESTPAVVGRREIVSREFFESIPTGRSFQTSVTAVPAAGVPAETGPRWLYFRGGQLGEQPLDNGRIVFSWSMADFRESRSSVYLLDGVVLDRFASR